MTFRSTYLWPVIAAIGVVTVAFAAVIAVSQYAAHDIRAALSDISSNASPSVHHLGEARSTAWDLEVRLMLATDNLASGVPVAIGDVPATLARLDGEWRAYEHAPKFQGEKELSENIGRDLARLRVQVLALSTALGRRDLVESRRLVHGELGETFEQVGRALQDLGRFNNQQGHLAALRAEESRRTSFRMAIILGTLVLILSCLLGWTVASGVRRLARLRAAHDRIQDERSAELEIFASRVAHDLRGPIASALLACDLIKRGRTTEIDRVSRSLKRMADLVHDLYEFARAGVEQPKGQRTDLRAAIDEALEEARPAAQEAGLHCVAEVVPDCRIPVSAGVVHSVLSNLLSNAIKYAGAGADVVVRARAGERVRIEVEDNGVGIPVEAQRHIFDPYFRVGVPRASGLGLGLATVKRLVERYGGACGVCSAPGRGALFWFDFPVSCEPAVTAGEKACPETNRPSPPPM